MTKKKLRKMREQQRAKRESAKLVRINTIKRDGIDVRLTRDNHVALKSGVSKYITFRRAMA